jgi:uncharacterized Zn-finger protein
LTAKPLDFIGGKAKIPHIPLLSPLGSGAGPNGMSSKPPSSKPAMTPPQKPGRCKHPRVQIVARHEDSEFVECVECGEVFESSEFKDMAIEEHLPLEEA